jgi:outer membrane protein assembly factor BamB
VWPGEALSGDLPPGDDERSEPDARHGVPDRERSRAWLAVAGLAVVGAVAAASLATQAGGGENGSEGSAEGWEAAELGNSQRLASDSERTCSVSADSLLFCLDPATGEQVFDHQFYVGMVTSPVLAEERVIVGAHGAGSPGALHAFSPSGDEVWTLAVDVTSDRRMAVVDGVMAVVSGGTTDGELVGVDADTGVELWRLFTGSEEDPSAPHVVSGNVFGDGTRFYVVVAAADPTAPTGIAGRVVALDPRSGEEAWRSEALPAVGWSRGASSAAAFDDGSALAFALDGVVAGPEDEPTDGAADDDPRVVVLDSATGELLWDVPMADGDLPGVAHVDGVTVVADGVAVRGYASDGERVWDTAVPGRDDTPTRPEPVMLDREGDRLFAVGRDVHQIDPATGQSGLVLASGTTTDVSVAGDHLVIAGVFAVTAVPVSELPLEARPETVVTG